MESRGIHPGVIGGRRAHPLANTAKPPKGSTRLEKRRSRLSKRRVAREMSIADMGRGSSKKIDYGRAFKVPGTMSQKSRW